ncbi:MAG TPA: phosphatidylserine decarboxylase family protein [Ignavibacteria bacterium]|nr:phosphatidylserine decarboxylase family protein [Ignavibacteria bacterium]
MIKLTPYGKDVIIKVFIFILVLIFSLFFINSNILKVFILIICIFFWIFTLYFFRDPERKLPSGYKSNQIISPGDGKVVVIENVINKYKNIFDEGEELVQISIFLSPLNVHVNRIPLNGIVKYLSYIKGDYIVAFDHKSSERNERSEIGIENFSTGNKILFKQIAGFVARRIVYDISEGNEVYAGDRFGMIKFGSRVDIFIKRNSKILVSINQKVTGGESIIAEF